MEAYCEGRTRRSGLCRCPIFSTGTIASADVTVNIACTVNPTYSINVQITNLLGSIGIALNGGAPTTITNSTGTPASESFSFLKIANGTAYDVTVATQPTGYTCATSNGSGTIASADVTVNIACTVNPTYSINVQITESPRGASASRSTVALPQRSPTARESRRASRSPSLKSQTAQRTM